MAASISCAGIPRPTAGMADFVVLPSVIRTVLSTAVEAAFGTAPLSVTLTDCRTVSPALST
jgi:hypothetical protein